MKQIRLIAANTGLADNYFGLIEDLQRLCGVHVDLVKPGPIRNPCFRQAIEQTQVMLYEAA